MDKVIESQTVDGNYSEEAFTRKSAQFAARFRKNTQKNGEELNTVKVQYAEAQDKFLSDLKTLEHDLKVMTQRGKYTEGKRHTEAQAFQSDVQSLRKRVTNYERYIKQLKEYVDKEDTAGLVQQLIQNQQLTELDLGKL